jgi:hypothetical protein
MNNNSKRHVAKRVECPECQSGGGAIPHRTLNKQAGQRRQEWQPTPSKFGVGKLITVVVMKKAPLESGEGAHPMGTVKKQDGWRRQV